MMGTVLQCRKFGFFDIQEESDEAHLSEALKDVKITSVSSGFGSIFIGDSKGYAHLIGRQLQVTSFEAHLSAVTIAMIHSNSNLAITCSNSKKGGPSEVKIWFPDRQDVQGLPVCARVMTVEPSGFVSERGQMLSPLVTAIALHPNNTLVAFGFSDGSVMLHRGDIRRPRGTKTKLIVTFSSGAVTNMHIRITQTTCHLFVTTASKIYCVNLTNKDKETSVELDDVGCDSGCSCLSDAKDDNFLLIAKTDAIYSYTTDSKGSCYVFEGTKKLVAMKKGYLIVASEESSMLYNKGNPSVNLTIYDPLNKLICLSTNLDDVCGIVYEWGSIYVVTNKPSLVRLAEKDLQSKFEILFKKNQFDIAISLAKVQCCDAEDVAEIVKQYGDWLYGKGNFSSAMDQYIKTIPHLEASYIIKKYLDIQHVQYLTTYLQALHKSGHSTSDHTMLLLNCYTRIQDSDQLDEFIMDKQGKLDCDVDIGIKVCRNSGYFDHALSLAEQYKRYSQYISILINDKQDYQRAIKYITTLPFEDAHENILQVGSTLLNHCPVETTNLLYMLCTDFKASNKTEELVTVNSGRRSPVRADPEDFEYLLVGHSEAATKFLEMLVKHRQLSPHLNTTLLAELLHQYSLSPEGQSRITLGDKILNMLRNNEINFNRDHALILCDKYMFEEGKLMLWEQAGMFTELLTWHAENNDYDNVLDTCRRHSETNNRLWCTALQLCTSQKSSPNQQLINIILMNIEELNLLPPMKVVEILSASPHISLGQIRGYLLQVMASQTASVFAEVTSIAQHKQKTEQMKEEISNITFKARDFTGTKCSVCKNNLDLPSIHFLCKHSFHIHCFESYTETESECPLCLPETKKIKESCATKVSNNIRHQALQDQLEKSTNCFDVISDFICQGVSDLQMLSSLHPSANTTKVPDLNTRKGIAEKTQPAVLSEGRLRLSEEPSKTLPKASEGRLRQTNTNKANLTHHNSSQPKEVSSSIEKYVSRTSSKVNLEQDNVKTSISSSVINADVPKNYSENPFERDESGNPFGDFETEEIDKNPFSDGYNDSKNPFAEDSLKLSPETSSKPKLSNPFEDYDESLNPFGDS